MHRIASVLTLGLLVALTGCPGDDSGTTAASASGDSTADTTPGTTTPGTTTPGTTTDSADTTAGSATTEDPATTDAPATTTDGPATTTDESESGADLCEPIRGGDPCEECAKANCCPEIEACTAVEECACFQDCLEKGGPLALNQCTTDCNAEDLAEVDALVECSSGNCLIECL